MEAAIVLFVYGLVVEAGGVIGFKKSGSQISLIAGSLAGSVLLAAAIMTWFEVTTGVYLGLVTTGLLIAFFGYRFGKTKAFVPSGLMLALSVIALVLLGWMLLRSV